jgi:hypothetical protein
MRVLPLMVMLVLVGLALAALPFDERHETPRTTSSPPAESEPRPQPRPESTPRPRPAVARARCPGDLPGCRSVRGRVLFVEGVDPDGDGDLHVVVLDGSVTAPGVTAVDVRTGLRPSRDPRVGEQVSAAGPVQPGSYGQQQIHALEFLAE